LQKLNCGYLDFYNPHIGALFAASVERGLFIHYSVNQTIIMSVAYFSNHHYTPSSTLPTFPKVCRSATQKTTGKCVHTGKMNSIDNQ
jgi:hypothetical protein